MPEVIILVIAVVCAIGGIFLGINIEKKNTEIKLNDLKTEMQNRIAQAMLKTKVAEREYQDLSSQLKAMASNNASVDEFNKLWQKVRSNLSSRT